MGLSLSLLPASSRADDTAVLDRSYVVVQLGVGFAGRRSGKQADFSTSSLVRLEHPIRTEDTLLPAYMLDIRYMLPLHRYFSVGALLDVLSWQSSGGSINHTSRNFGVDLGVVPQGRLPIISRWELYLAVPVGLTLDFWNEVSMRGVIGNGGSSSSSTLVVPGQAHALPAVGYRLGVMLGTRVALTDQFGLCAEFAYMRRGTSVTVVMEPEAAVPRGAVPNARADTDISYWQWFGLAGICF